MSGRRSPDRTASPLRLDRVLAATLVALAVPATLGLAPPASASAPRLRAPVGPLLLTREIRRTLADGQVLVVRRRYTIRIVPAADGQLVTGEPAGVDVEAPAALASLAEVERNRAEHGPFPLRLDAAGQIVAQPAPAETVDAEQARRAVAAYLARADLTAQERMATEAIALKLQGQAQSAGSGWPADLFHPTTGARREERAIALPDGRQGRVIVTVEASEGASGLLAAMERRVVTELDGTARLTTERWILTPAP